MNEIYEFLKNSKTYYLATVEDKQPKVRPFGTVLIFENKLYIQTGKVKAVSKQIAANPKISLCAMDASGKWLRLEAEAVEDDRSAPRKAMLDAYPELRGMYNENDGNTQVFYLKNVSATIESFTEAKQSYTF